jgi:hypothetical protein
VAEYTVTVYYTTTFRDNTADPHTFIDQVKDEKFQSGYSILISMLKSQQYWIRSQHTPTQWNLRGGR